MGFFATVLTGMGVSLAVRSGRRLAEDRGWMPAGHYHRLAGEAVEQGDLDGAIFNNGRAGQGDEAGRDLEPRLL